MFSFGSSRTRHNRETTFSMIKTKDLILIVIRWHITNKKAEEEILLYKLTLMEKIIEIVSTFFLSNICCLNEKFDLQFFCVTYSFDFFIKSRCIETSSFFSRFSSSIHSILFKQIDLHCVFSHENRMMNCQNLSNRSQNIFIQTMSMFSLWSMKINSMFRHWIKIRRPFDMFKFRTIYVWNTDIEIQQV